MSYYLGGQLKENLMANRPTRCKSTGDYTGQAIPPCGEFAPSRSVSTPPWWRKASLKRVKANPRSLHEDIVMFMEYLEPTAIEAKLRANLVARFTNLVESFGLNATVRPVGSYVTGLYLPTSDVDMVLTFNHKDTSSRYCYKSTSFTKYDLYDVLQKIRRSGFASRVEDVLSASTPLIRVIDKKTGLQIDLTASDTHAFKATDAVQKWMKGDFELIKALITVVKMFLAARRCSTTYTGGINSYVLVWMVVAWVKLEWPTIRRHRDPLPTSEDDLASVLRNMSIGASSAGPQTGAKAPTSQRADLGYALRKFLKFYGREFDYYHQAIVIEPKPLYKTKTYSYSRYPNTQPYLLSIFDPADDNEDMGKKAYAIKHIQASFKEAHESILKLEAKARIDSGGNQSILSNVLGADFAAFVTRREQLNAVV